MATKVRVISTEYLRELPNGQDFLTNTGDFSDHLLGHVGDRQRLKMTVQLSNQLTLGRYEITGDDTITLTSGQSFLTEDFYAGGVGYLSHLGGTESNWEFDIVNISTDGTVMTCANIVEKDNAGTPTGGTTLPNGTYSTGTSQDILRSLVESNGLVCKFGFIPNNGNITFVSPLDNIEQAYKFDGLRPGGAPGPVITGTWNSNINGSNTGVMTAQFIQTVQDNGVNKTSTASTARINSIQEFEIIQEFIIPYYEEGEFTNVESQTPPDRLVNNLKQIFEFEFRQNLSDPNKTQFGEYNTVLGNVRYYGDNYIDSAQQYSVSNVVLTDTATSQTITEINASSTTRVTASINSANSTFLTTDPVLIEHSYLPNGDQYSNQTDVFTDVWLRESLRNTIDAVAANGTIITGFTATLISAAQIDIQFDIAFSVAQQTQIQAGYNYELSIKVADTSLTVPFSDVTKLIIDANQYSLNTDIAGLANFPQSYVYTRPMMYPIVTPGDRFTSARGWIQDGFLYDWTMNLDLVEGAVLEALTLRLVAFQTLENTWFELDNYSYDLSGQVVTVGPPDVQNITVDKTRGYDLADGDKLNFAKLQTGTYSAPNQPYTGQTAFRWSWQDWISLPTADTVFYNPAELNNGLNKQSNRYSLQNNYVICVLIDARISKDGVITQYIDRSANLEVYDFGEQDGSPITWTGTIQTFDDSGADLGGTLLTEGLTTIKGTFDGDSPVVDPSLYWGEVRLERLNNPGDDYFVLSTLEAGAENNPLQAPTGSTYAKIELISGDIIVSVDLNPDLLPDAGPWNPSVRMGLIDQSVPVVPTVKVQIDGNTRQSSGDFIVFQQAEIMAGATFVNNLFSLGTAATPGTPPGWQFKVSPTSAQPGGDATVKANWSAIAYIDFTTLAATLGSESDRWVYVEADDTAKIDEGFIIEFERPQVSQNSSSILIVQPADSIDQDTPIYFDRLINVTGITITGTIPGTGIPDAWFSIRQDTPTNEDWTVFKDIFQSTPGTINTELSNLGIIDGDKWCLHWFNRNMLNTANQVTIDFDYVSAVNAEKGTNGSTAHVNQNDINVQYRPFGNCMAFAFTADQQHVATPATDTALLDLFDFTISGQPWTICGWVQMRTGPGQNDRQAFWGPLNHSFTSTQGGILIQTVALPSNNPTNYTLAVTAQGNSSTNRRTIQWQYCNWADDKRAFICVSSDGTNTLAGYDFWYNGVRANDADLTESNVGSIIGACRPNDNQYRHGRWTTSIGDVNQQFAKTQGIRIYDRVLTGEEIRKAFNDHTLTFSGLFRDYDFPNFAAGAVPELVAGPATDGIIVTGGAQPTNPTFY